MPKTQAEMDEMQQHRNMMYQTTHNLKLLFWGYVALSCAFMILGVAASALQAGDDANVGPAKWYYGFESGMLEIAVSVITLILAFLVFMKNRLCSLILLGVHACLFILAITGAMTTFTKINILPTALGIMLGVWGQLQFRQLAYLKEQKGYPHFSAYADEPAHYDSLYHVHRAQHPGDAMQGVGEAEPSRRFAPDRPHTAGVTEESLHLNDITQGDVRQGAKQSAIMPQADIALDAMADSAVSGKTEVLPEATQAVLLDDMTAEGSAQTKQYAPDADALPTPEEVRARLAAMKQAQQNPPQ